MQRDLNAQRLADWLGGLDRPKLAGDGGERARACARPARRDASPTSASSSRSADAMKHKVKRVHFVGIGGAGMSGIAEVLATQGYRDLRLGSSATAR